MYLSEMQEPAAEIPFEIDRNWHTISDSRTQCLAVVGREVFKDADLVRDAIVKTLLLHV